MLEKTGHEPHVDCLIYRLLEIDFCACVCVFVCVGFNKGGNSLPLGFAPT